MIKTTGMILEELKHYANPAAKLGRMVQAGEYIPIVRGLYETDKNTAGYLLAGSIYGPSYLSFDFALAYYDMIPEAVYAFTSATFDKKKKKVYETPFGRFTYRDVPEGAYPLEIRLIQEGEYSFQIAAPEKALCDKVYEIAPVKSIKAMMKLLTEDLRIEEEILCGLDYDLVNEISEHYHASNTGLLVKALKRLR